MAPRLDELGRRFEDLFAAGFHSYGCFVARHPGKILIASLLFVVLCAPGIAYIQINLDLFKLFVPHDAPVKTEFLREQEFNRMPVGDLTLNVTKDVAKRSAPRHTDIIRYYVVHKEYRNLLQSDTLGLLYNFTLEMMKVTNDFNGRTWTLEDFCRKEGNDQKCNNNLNVWLKHADLLFRDGEGRKNPNIQLSYPVMYLFNRPKDIGNVVYGVNVTGEKHEIIGARVLTIHWFINFESTPEAELAYMPFRQKLNKFWDQKTAETDIQWIPHNDKAMDDELNLIILNSVPFAIPVSIQLMLFVIFSNWSTDKRKSKPMEAYIGVISVILSLVCTFGITFFFGLPFNPVSSTMPFLILAVGVDDAFLLLGAWRTSNPKDSVEKRMGHTMGDAGASITVTSLTNFGCFALGYFLCSTPAVGDFCMLTAIGVMMDYVFQVTFFSAFMVYGGMKEERGGLMSCYYEKCKKKNDDVDVDAEQEAPAEVDNTPTLMHWFFEYKLAPFILRKEVMAASWVLFVGYVFLSIYGCSNIMVDISPKKYIRDDSPIQTFVHLADKYIWADNVMPTFHVMNPPDLRDAGQRARLNELVFRLEHTDYSIGRVSTNMWVWQYQQYLNDFPEVDYDSGFYNRKLLNNFFNQIDYVQYRGKVKINDSIPDGEPCVSAFSFQTSFYGLDSWDKRQAELFHWRKIISEYPEFDMFLSGIFSPFLIDQRKSIAPSSMQSIGSAIAVMAFISTFFLPDKQSVFVMTWSLLSISCGVCGFLSLWGSDLDSVSMGCIVMAIGLAVDFSIHICYRYHRSEELTAQRKVIDTLAVVGYPVLQAGLSTLIAMVTLPLIKAYLVRVFFQTVVLVNVIGLFHALVWLPQIICALDPIDRVPLRIKHQMLDGAQ
ncbi:hypothetical protein QR680_018223 [Steinernema hermaphroditum]|uniref:SSD domain-containing protein n=1 Tax=Steinernema hermaphroditum TaxID=289476 RepID=A0AA39HJG7_9BILA|nr:hypothetical protein QR680_018223 [Steinernema hermaphroditum]